MRVFVVTGQQSDVAGQESAVNGRVEQMYADVGHWQVSHEVHGRSAACTVPSFGASAAPAANDSTASRSSERSSFFPIAASPVKVDAQQSNVLGHE
jgi:hypothetical protein